MMFMYIPDLPRVSRNKTNITALINITQNMIIKHLLSILFLSSFTVSTACIASDSSNNLYLFGTPKGDFAISTTTTSPASSWSQLPSSPQNRPDFNVQKGTQCLLAQYSNALVVINGNSASSMLISTYFFANNSWLVTTATGSVE